MPQVKLSRLILQHLNLGAERRVREDNVELPESVGLGEQVTRPALVFGCGVKRVFLYDATPPIARDSHICSRNLY